MEETGRRVREAADLKVKQHQREKESVPQSAGFLNIKNICPLKVTHMINCKTGCILPAALDSPEFVSCSL